MRDRIVIANWKMNGSREANARWTDEFLSSPQPACRTVVCAPFVYLGELALRALGTHLEVGAEDVNENPAGAFTGEISAGMLHDIGMSCAIVGHSERRTLYGETDNRVAMKALALVKAGLKPVVCVGETLEERETGATPSVILRQLNAVLTIVRPEDLLAVAYEPVWAIGTGKTATADQAEEVCAQIRKVIGEVYGEAVAEATTVQYGGSMNAKNCEELLSKKDVDGGLIGGASLKAPDFAVIVNAATKG